MLELTEHSLWRFSRVFHKALRDQAFDELESLIDEDILWLIHGPIDKFPFMGSRTGKSAVIEVCRQMSASFRIRRFDRETLMLGPESAASMLRYSLSHVASEKALSLRLTHFLQFRDGRLRRLNALVDSLELVEQVIGQQAHLPATAAYAGRVA